MMEKAIITIAVPVYNEEKFIREALQSILDQNFNQYEVLIVDNCSEDNTWNIIQEFVQNDNRFKAIQHEKNKGLFYNWNYTLTKIDTEYFMWLGAHDILEKEFLSKTIKNLEENDSKNIVLSFTKAACIDLESNLLAPTDKNFINFNDKIDTTDNISINHKWMKILDEANTCTAIQGVFRSKIIQNIGLKMIHGLDNLLLFSIVEHGDIYIDKEYIGYKRRINIPESNKQIIDKKPKRTIIAKIITHLNGQNSMNLYFHLVKEYIKVVIRSEKVPFLKKIHMIIIIYNVHRKKRNLWNPFIYLFKK